MRAGPGQMYASQTAAFQARDRVVRPVTSSTPDSPPKWQAPDLEELCRLKRQVLADLPKNCFHCGARYPPNTEVKGTFVELKDGSIMAYCKTPGACGKSHVLFAGVALVAPRYEKVCPFVSRIDAVNFSDLDLPQQGQASSLAACQLLHAEPLLAQASAEAVVTSIATADAGAASAAAGAPSDVPFAAQQARQWDASEEAVLASLSQPQSQLDWHELHNPTCTSCGQRFLDHAPDCDAHGWRPCGATPLSPPTGWPEYNPRTGTWHELDALSGSPRPCSLS